MTKNRKGNIAIILLISIVLVLGLLVIVYRFATTPKNQTFYAEPAGIDTRVPTQKEIDNPPNSLEEIAAVETSHILSYYNAMYGIKFSYPDYWGNPNFSINKNIPIIADPYVESCAKQGNTAKISQPVTINFNASKCGSEGCETTIYVYTYDNNHHFKIGGDETTCDLTDLFSVETDIKKNFNATISGRLAIINDGSNINHNETRDIKILFPGKIVEIYAAYQARNYKLFANKENISGPYLDSLLGQNLNDPIYTMLGLYLKDLRATAESLSVQ